MSRLVNTALRNRFKGGASTAIARLGPAHRNFMVVMKNIQGSGYMEKFSRQCKTVVFIEYYTVEYPEESVYDLYGYIQLDRARPVAKISEFFNVKTQITATTVSEKLSSKFHNNGLKKITIGKERTLISSTFPHPSDNPIFQQVGVKTFFSTDKIPVPEEKCLKCWLPQPPKIDPLLNRKRIYPLGYEEK